MKVFDVHHHFGSPHSGSMPEISEDFMKRTKVMERCGINRAVMMPSTGYYMPNGILDTKKFNDKMAEYKRLHPDLFPVALGTVEPRHGKASLEEIDRMINELKLDGIMWHHRSTGTEIDHEMTILCLTKISEMKVPVPVFIHNFCESQLEAPWRLEKLAGMFPNLTFISLSSLASNDHIRRMMLIAKRQKNIYLDTSMLMPLQNIIELIVKEIGSHRLLFGSGTYSEPVAIDPQITLEIIKKSKISDEEKANILEKNVKNILGGLL